MKKSIVFPACWMILLLLVGTAASEQGEQVPFGMNGEAWISLEQAGGLDHESDRAVARLFKMGVLRGVYDGLMFGQSPLLDKFYTRTSLSDLVSAMDRFYGDKRNLKIPVVVGLWVVSMELSGEPKEKLEAPLRELRRSYSVPRQDGG